MDYVIINKHIINSSDINMLSQSGNNDFIITIPLHEPFGFIIFYLFGCCHDFIKNVFESDPRNQRPLISVKFTPRLQTLISQKMNLSAVVLMSES